MTVARSWWRFRPPKEGTGRDARSRWFNAPGRRRRTLLVALSATLAGTIGIAVGVYAATRQHTSTARLMSLSPVPHQMAPDFSLVDQNGRRLSLSSFRGKAVALYFMDPRCTDVCPLVAQEFIDADRYLGPAAAHVALVGVDVNPGFTAVHWLRAFDSAHGLDRLSNWHFFTGSLSQLRKVWGKYSISVQLDPKTGDITHTTVIDFIGRDGREMAMATPYAYTHHNGTAYLPGGQMTRWGHGIAKQLRVLVDS